jgi:uncharacterized protein YraI
MVPMRRMGRRSILAPVLLGAVVTAALIATPQSAASAVSELATVKTSANLRAAPNTTSRVIRDLPAGTEIMVDCWTSGEPTYGSGKYGSMWLYANNVGYVHSFLVSPVDVGPCGVTEAPSGVYYKNCDAARAAGAAPVLRGEPGYGPHLDRDGDGIGCEWD